MKSLAVKYRPRSWDAVVGQDVIVDILRKQLSTKNIKNAYIFSGASGCGKTTAARIFANELNNHQGEPIEIDGASNNGVDNVKQIISSASQRSLNSEYKIYIIDEAHMLTTQAWNAFLKTIEESPKYTIFIFCTTDPQKIPDTIKNRCMRFNFTRISSDVILSRLRYICMQEHITNYQDSIDYISRTSNGEMRNAISKLETCLDYSNNMDIQTTLKALGNFSYEVFFDLTNNIIDGKFDNVSSLIDDIYNDGGDITNFVNNYLGFLLDITKYSLNKDIKCTSIPNVYQQKLDFSIAFDNANQYYNYYIDSVLDLKNMLKSDPTPYYTVMVIFNKMCRLV